MGDEHKLSGGIDGEVARAGVAGRLLVEPVQLTARHIQRESRHAAAALAVERADLVDGVQVATAWVNLEERRVFQAVHGAEFLQRTAFQVELEQMNALLVGGRVAAKTDQRRGRRGGRLAKRHGEAKRGERRRPEKCTECHPPDETETKHRWQAVLRFIALTGLLGMARRETAFAHHPISSLRVCGRLVLERLPRPVREHTA